MKIYEIAIGTALLVACIAIMVLTLLVKNEQSGLSAAINGGSLQAIENKKNSPQAKLNRIITGLGAAAFVGVVLLGFLSAHMG